MSASISNALDDGYGGIADENAYLVALKFLLEKIDAYSSHKKILIADEAMEQPLNAIRMVADMQDWGGGMVPGSRLRTVIDSMHFVKSHTSLGRAVGRPCGLCAPEEVERTGIRTRAL